MTDGDRVSLPDSDFRRERVLLSPSVFFWPNGEPDVWAPHTDMINRHAWDDITGLATHVALESSRHAGSVITRLNWLNSDWASSWPDPGTAPFMDYPALIVGEEFDALVFNALHGYYRQAIGCLRVALEVVAMAAAFAVTGDTTAFRAWQEGRIEAKFGRARVLLRDSTEGRRIDSAASPGSVFSDANDSWLNVRPDLHRPGSSLR